MTSNIAGALFNVLLAAFFLVVILGVAIGAYAASALRRQEAGSAAIPDEPAPRVPEVSTPIVPAVATAGEVAPMVPRVPDVSEPAMPSSPETPMSSALPADDAPTTPAL